MTHTLTFPHYDGFIEPGCSRRLQQQCSSGKWAIRFTLNLLIITILVGLVGVVVKTFMDLRLLLSADLEVALRRIMSTRSRSLRKVLKTALTYCSDGRVRVTFIVDTGPGGHVDRDHFSLVLRRRMAAIRSAYSIVTGGLHSGHKSASTMHRPNGAREPSGVVELSTFMAEEVSVYGQRTARSCPLVRCVRLFPDDHRRIGAWIGHETWSLE